MLTLRSIREKVESIKSNFDLIPQEQRSIIEKEVNKIDYAMLFSFQTIQSQAFATMKIDFDASMWLYRKLGGDLPSPKKWAELPLEEKMFITVALGALTHVELGNSSKTH